MFYITNEESFLSFFFPLRLTVRINLVYSGSSIYGVDGDHFCETSGIKEPLAETLIRPVRKSKRWKHRKFFFFFFKLTYFYVYVCLACVCICMWTTCMPGAQRGQKRVVNLLEVELRMVMSYHMGTGTEPNSSARAVSVLIHRAISPVPPDKILNFISIIGTIFKFFLSLTALMLTTCYSRYSEWEAEHCCRYK